MKARLPEGYSGKGNNMNSMIRQAQKMQEEMTRVQGELEEREFSATAGGGAVEVVMTGKKQMKSIVLKPEVVNEALTKVEETSAAEMEKVTGGLNIPGLF